MATYDPDAMSVDRKQTIPLFNLPFEFGEYMFVDDLIINKTIKDDAD